MTEGAPTTRRLRARDGMLLIPIASGLLMRSRPVQALLVRATILASRLRRVP